MSQPFPGAPDLYPREVRKKCARSAQQKSAKRSKKSAP